MPLEADWAGKASGAQAGTGTERRVLSRRIERRRRFAFTPEVKLLRPHLGPFRRQKHRSESASRHRHTNFAPLDLGRLIVTRFVAFESHRRPR
jgi:hypothetical protein